MVKEIVELQAKLEIAKEERKKVVAPYDARIKKLKDAINSLNSFENLSQEINSQTYTEVTTLTPEEVSEE